ncbi:MAG: DUF4397 domain-containing protein [Ignavibacteria bacterium]|nr:DUF4397 domain-containing protein [Ignavibacteria bacterium]
MRLKKNSLIGFIMISIVAFGIFSCVDEPILDPPNRPFAVIRIANLSANVSNMNVFVDKAQPVADLSDLAISEATPFFDIVAGKRLITIIDRANGDTIYNKSVEFSSYTEQSLFFIGEYSNIDTLTNFKDFSFNEGLTYVDNAPVSGRAKVVFVHLLTQALNPLTDPPAIVDVFDNSEGKDSIVVENLPFTESNGFNNASTGIRKFVFKKFYTNQIVGVDSLDVLTGKQYLILLTGNALNPQVSRLTSDPLPVRGK